MALLFAIHCHAQSPASTPGHSAADFERLHSKVLTKLPGVARVDSSFVLRPVVKQAGLPLD